jgi:thioredoxin-related protein
VPFSRIKARRCRQKGSFSKREDEIVKTFLRSGILVLLLMSGGAAFSSSSADVLATDDWSAEAAEARRFGAPILILFSDDDCGYCERLKKDVLEPLARRGELRSFAGIRELDIDRGGKIIDFDGEKIRTRLFVKRYGVYATPTLMLVDYRGRSLGTPVVGFNDREEYIPYLEQFVDVAYWEPQKVELPCEKQRAAEPVSIVNADLENAVYLSQAGGF